MKICVLLISLFGLLSLHRALTCQENARDAEKFEKRADLGSSILKSIDGLTDDEISDVMQSSKEFPDGPFLRDGSHMSVSALEDDMRNIEAGPCSCNSKQCVCCGSKVYTYLLWHKIRLNACYRLIPLHRHYSAVLTYILNGRVVYHAIINMLRPPHRVCKRIPNFLKVLTKSDICLEFTKVDAARRIVCAHATGWIKVPLKTYHFYANYGCVKLPTVGNSDQQYLDLNTEFEDLEFTKPSSSDLKDVRRSYEGDNDIDDVIEDVDDLKLPRTGEYDLDDAELLDEDESDLDTYLEIVKNMRRRTIINDLDNPEIADEGHDGLGVDNDLIRDDEQNGENKHGGGEVMDGKNDDDSFFFEEV